MTAVAGISGEISRPRTPRLEADKSVQAGVTVASASITTLAPRIPRTSKIAEAATRTGKVVTGGIVSVRDSSWLLAGTVNRQHTSNNNPQPDGRWFYRSLSTGPETTSKSDGDCTDRRSQRSAYHLGVPLMTRPGGREGPSRFLHDALMTAFSDAYGTDRPKGCAGWSEELRLIGQFAESTRD